MSTETQTPKRGRPAGSTNKKPASPKQSIKKSAPKITRSIPENKTLEYNTVRKSGATFLLQQRGVVVHDKGTDTVREIRYCPNEPSIFRDEQSDKSVRRSVVFNEGRLFVPPNKPNLRDYLNAHPGNQANGGAMFFLVNKEKNSEAELDREFLMLDAVSMIRDKDLEELLPVAISYGFNINRPVSEIKHDLMVIAKKDPKKFIEAFDNPAVEMKTRVTLAKKYQIIKLDKDGVKWYDTNKLIVSVPAGKKPMDVAVRYLLTEAAVPVVEEIDRQLP
jgi:hypothetical protein